MANRNRSKLHWVRSLPFLLMHVGMIGAFFVPFGWGWVALCAASYWVRLFGVTAGYHRYFSHRSYELNRLFQFLLAFLAQTSVQKGVLWWAAIHRHHHRFSDRPEDIHSPVQKGFWWSHVGWILSDAHDETLWELVRDLSRFPELRWLDHHPILPGVLYGLALLAVGGLPAFFWGFVVSTVLLWHGTFTINSLSHVFGSRRYRTNDTSRNNFGLALLTLGEGWHNNHHCFQSSARQGFFWWEVDLTYYVLKALSFAGITRELRQPPLKLLEPRRITSSLAVRPVASGEPVFRAPLRSEIT